MQALIDFDGWRKWKAFAEEKEAGMTEEERQKMKEKEEKEKIKMEKMAKLLTEECKATAVMYDWKEFPDCLAKVEASIPNL